MKTITISNQKGGVAKSTTALTLASGLAMRGKKILLLDMDAQGNLSLTAAVDRNAISIKEVLLRKANITDAIQSINNIDIVPANISLASADLELVELDKNYRLQEALLPLKENYDYCIIDTPPALNILTVNAFTCTDYVIIPAQADIYSLDAVGQLQNTINTIKRYVNPGLVVDGILLTRYNDRSNLTKGLTEVIEQTATQLNTRLYKTTIREAIAIKESQARQQNIFDYAPKSKVALDYLAFINEFLEDKE